MADQVRPGSSPSRCSAHPGECERLANSQSNYAPAGSVTAKVLPADIEKVTLPGLSQRRIVIAPFQPLDDLIVTSSGFSVGRSRVDSDPPLLAKEPYGGDA